jgi:hypothetical protein
MSCADDIPSPAESLPGDESCATAAQSDADLWDLQFETDVAAGKPDRLAERALREDEAGRCTKL